MLILQLLLLLAGAVCLLMAAFGFAPTNPRRTIQLGWLGLFFWILVPLIQVFTKLV